MKFNIKKIEVKNFRSIQEEIALEIKPGLFSIEGINYDENMGRNGVGKSTLISAIYWCLTGNTLTNEEFADDVINLIAKKDCRVTLYIESDTDKIKIIRTRKDTEFGNNLLLFIGEQDLSCHKVTDTQQRINQLIKIPFELLHSTIMMTGDMKSAFLDLTPQQRIKALESIRDYSIWDKVRDESNKDIKLYFAKIQELSLKNSNLSGQYTTFNNLYTENITKLENFKKEFNKDESLKNIKSIKENINSLNVKININKQELEKITSLNEDEYVKLCEERDTITTEANTTKENILQLNLKLEKKKDQINTIEEWFKNDICPTCKQKLNRTEEIIKAKKIELDNLKEKKASLENQIVSLEKIVNEKRTLWTDYTKKIKEFDALKSTKNKRINDLNSEIMSLNVLIQNNNAKIIKIESQLENYDNTINTLNEQINTYSLKKADLQKEISVCGEEIKALTNKKQLSEYFYKLLGAKGELRPYLLNKDIQNLNSYMQKYIIRFFKNTDVNLELSGSNILVNINSLGVKKTIHMLSDGEKKRLNLSIQLALYDLIESTSQIGFNMLWLDEIESKLDPLGCRQLIEIIEDKSTNIESVYWISNNPMVNENINSKIMCIKKHGKTSIEEMN